MNRWCLDHRSGFCSCDARWLFSVHANIDCITDNVVTWVRGFILQEENVFKFKLNHTGSFLECGHMCMKSYIKIDSLIDLHDDISLSSCPIR